MVIMIIRNTVDMIFGIIAGIFICGWTVIEIVVKQHHISDFMWLKVLMFGCMASMFITWIACYKKIDASEDDEADKCVHKQDSLLIMVGILFVAALTWLITHENIYMTVLCVVQGGCIGLICLHFCTCEIQQFICKDECIDS